MLMQRGVRNYANSTWQVPLATQISQTFSGAGHNRACRQCH